MSTQSQRLRGSDDDLFRHFFEVEVQAERMRKRQQSVINFVGRLVMVGAIIGGWFLLASFYPPLIVPDMIETWQGFVKGKEEIWENLLPTVIEIALGFAMGVAGGLGFGALIAQSKWAEVVIRPYLVISQAVPKVVLVPILIILLGFGILPKITIAALICFFPLLENTITGLSRVDPDSLRLFQSLGASQWKIFLKLRVYSALPLVFAGIRIAAVLATLGAIVAEYFAGNKGLGAQLAISLGLLNGKLMYATMVVLTMLAFTVYVSALYVERKVLEKNNLQAEE